jgi:hypothetical protein
MSNRVLDVLVAKIVLQAPRVVSRISLGSYNGNTPAYLALDLHFSSVSTGSSSAILPPPDVTEGGLFLGIAPTSCFDCNPYFTFDAVVTLTQVDTSAAFTFSGTVVDTGPQNFSPVPPTLPLFATGLGVLGLLGWRRKRRAQAAV